MSRRSRTKLLKAVFRREPGLWEPLKRGGPHKDRRRKRKRDRYFEGEEW